MQQEKRGDNNTGSAITVKLAVATFNESNRSRRGWLYGICGQQLDEIEVKDAKMHGYDN
jgi:hypothetical protein